MTTSAGLFSAKLWPNYVGARTKDTLSCFPSPPPVFFYQPYCSISIIEHIGTCFFFTTQLQHTHLKQIVVLEKWYTCKGLMFCCSFLFFSFLLFCLLLLLMLCVGFLQRVLCSLVLFFFVMFSFLLCHCGWCFLLVCCERS